MKTASMGEALNALEKAISYSFQNKALLATALTHKSYNNENSSPQGSYENYERLEFLGDAVISLSVGFSLMKHRPDANEGELTKYRSHVVQEETLAWVAESISLGKYLFMGRGEEQSGGRHKPSVLSDVFEALMGAVFLDSGFSQADHIIRHLLTPFIKKAVQGELNRDSKSLLQERIQAEYKVTPTYRVIDQSDDKQNRFLAAVFVNDEELARAVGPSKKAAEQEAAKQALEKKA